MILKRKTPLLLLFVLFIYNPSSSQSIEEWVELERKKQANHKIEQEKLFDSYNKRSTQDFDKWNKKQEKEFSDFKAKTLKSWGDFHTPTQKKWVEYSDDGKSVSVVDFEKGIIKIEVLAEDQEKPNQVKKNLTQAITRVLTSQGSSSAAPQEGGQIVSHKPILVDQVDGLNLASKNEAKKIAQKEIKQSNKEKLKSGKVKHTVILKMAPNHIQKRAKPYLELVNKYSRKYGVAADHILATIHTESYFNPMAKSHVGAIGLMQLMPQFGGKEAYEHVTGKDTRPTTSYLYKVENNIELGCVYISLLQKNYFKHVKDKTSLRYLSIAAYNTGPGNTARAFTNKKVIGPAVKIINNQNSNWVYHKLKEDLPYEETRDYLEKVEKRRNIYR